MTDINITDFLKSAENAIAKIADDEVIGDVDAWIDTGSYTLNAVVSGSLFGGFPNNKIIGLSGAEASGKSFFALSACKNFLDMNPNALIVYFESESALTKKMLESRKLDLKRFLIFPVATVEEFRTQCIKLTNKYIDDGKKFPLLIVLDSLGNLSTSKEMTDTEKGEGTRDMTRAQVIKGAFRVLSLKLGSAGIPIIVTNHTYDAIGSYFPTKIMSGGCLLEGTQIIMADGSFRNIEDVRVGEYVLTEIDKEEVIKTWCPNTLEEPEPECVRIYFDDETYVDCSKEHKFRINGMWIEARNLLEGDEVECR